MVNVTVIGDVSAFYRIFAFATTPPENPVPGSCYYSVDESCLYVYDGNTNSWQKFVTQSADISTVMVLIDSDVDNPRRGMVKIENNQLYIYDGTSWILITGGELWSNSIFYDTSIFGYSGVTGVINQDVYAGYLKVYIPIPYSKAIAYFYVNGQKAEIMHEFTNFNNQNYLVLHLYGKYPEAINIKLIDGNQILYKNYVTTEQMTFDNPYNPLVPQIKCEVDTTSLFEGILVSSNSLVKTAITNRYKAVDDTGAEVLYGYYWFYPSDTIRVRLIIYHATKYITFYPNEQPSPAPPIYSVDFLYPSAAFVETTVTSDTVLAVGKSTITAYDTDGNELISGTKIAANLDTEQTFTLRSSSLFRYYKPSKVFLSDLGVSGWSTL